MAHEEGHVETKTEKLARIRAKLNIVTSSEDEIDPDSGLTMADRARLTATGLLFNWADEAVAGVKALSPNITYDEALTKERKELKSAQSKKGSLKYEIGGALLPTAGALIASPFTGGTSMAATVPTWARLLGIGATQGFAYGTGGSEEEGLARVKDAPVATLTGAIANPVFGKLTQATKVAITPLLDSVKRKYSGQVSKKVNNEILRILTDSGLSVEDFLENIRKGQILPEMSEEAAVVVSGFASKAGPGSPIIRDAIYERKNKFINDVYQTLQKDLAPEVRGGNIYKTFSDDVDKLTASESASYNKIWESTADQTFKEIDNVVLNLAKLSRNSRNIINKKLDENGIKSIFKLVGKGKNQKIVLTRSLTLKEGEIVKRAFMDAKTKSQRAGTKDKSGTMKGYENQIRNVLDNISPELKETRNNWSMIRNSVDQYNTGKKVFGQNPEEFAVEFQRLLALGDTNAIDALRAGAAASLKLKSQSSSATGTITKLADSAMGINQKEREILEILYPGDKIEDILVKVNQARGSIVASSKTFAGSPTAERIGSGDRVGNVKQMGADLGRFFISNGMDIGATTNIITKMFGGKKPPFTDKQYKEIAEIVVADNSDIIINFGKKQKTLKGADVLESQILNSTKMNSIINSFNKAIDVVTSSQPRVELSTKLTERLGDIYDPLLSIPFSADFMAANAGTLTEEDLERGDVNLSTYPPIVQSGEMSPEEWNASIASEENFESGALSNIASTIKPSARRKILDAANIQ